MKRKNNSGQQEMVGFIIIILMVMIIGVIFLGISLRKSMMGGVEATDAEIANFLSALNGYKTDCAKDYEPNYRVMEEVIADCYGNGECLDGRKSCEVLNKTYSDVLQSFKPAGRQISAYSVNFYYMANSSAPISDGQKLDFGFYSGETAMCKSKRAGRADISLGSSGDIVQVLEICLIEE